MKKIVIIDGHGGRIGALLTARLKPTQSTEIVAIGTNSIATSAMLKAGADFGATGENPIIVNARDADFIVGALGILSADSFLGEITPAMAVAIGQSQAEKVLLPINRCNNYIVGVEERPIAELIESAAQYIEQKLTS